ncbi:MAG: hypothetical protein RIC38_08940 [Chromatocurvus sp.]
MTGGAAQADRFELELPTGAPEPIYDGRLILIIAAGDEKEPRDQVSPDYDAAQIFGINVDGWKRGGRRQIDDGILGFPALSLKEVPAGEYTVQAVLHKYGTFTLSNGKTVKLPAARGAGQNWRKEPGNLFSQPVKLRIDPDSTEVQRLVLSEVNPPIAEPEDTEYVRHIRIRSELLSEFWGTDVYLRAHVLVPRGFDEHPEARFPLAIFHGHFPAYFGVFQTTSPEPDAECVYSARFDLDCYNRIQEQDAYDFYQYWISDDAPRMGYFDRMFGAYQNNENCLPVVNPAVTDVGEAFDNRDIYTKGSWLLHTLRNYIGEEAFWAGTRRLVFGTSEPWSLPYPIAPRYRTTEDFIRIMSGEAGEDVAGLVETYLYEADMPELRVERTDAGLELVWKTPGDRPFPIPVSVSGDGEVVSVSVTTDAVASIAVAADARAIIDPDSDILRSLPIENVVACVSCPRR